jgi:hypothetical protein
MNSLPKSDSEPPSQPRPGALQAALLVAGSMLLGGLAVVLWNRSSLSRLRQPAEIPPAPVSPDGEDE